MGWKMIVPDLPKKNRSTHIEKNVAMFETFGVHSEYLSNSQLLKDELSGYQAVYMNWFENIDGGAAYMPILRYFRRQLQLSRMKRAGLKLIFCKHNRFPHNPKYPLLSKKLYKRICDLADVIVAFNDDAEQDLLQVFPGSRYGEKITVIPPVNYIGVYPENPQSAIYRLREKHAGQMCIGYIGRIQPYKNVELILQAAKEMQAEMPDAYFLIAGEPYSEEYGQKLKAMAQGLKNVETLFERVADEDMAPLMEVSDILVMPYDKRSASNSGAGRLAFSYGRTVVSPDISSMNMLPEELIYKYHYDTDAEHPALFIGKIREAYQAWKKQPDSLMDKGKYLKTIMERDYSEQAIEQKYRDMFKHLLQK